MNWTALFGSKAVLEAENARLRRVLAEQQSRLSEMSAALDDALDREQLHSLSAPHERLTPAAVLDRYGQARASHPAPESAAVQRGTAPQESARSWMTSLESTAASVTVGRDRRRSR